MAVMPDVSVKKGYKMAQMDDMEEMSYEESTKDSS